MMLNNNIPKFDKSFFNKKPKSNKSSFNIPSINIDAVFNKNLFNNKKTNGASVSNQNLWRGLNMTQRNIMRSKHKDSDGDRVPDMFDCQPYNIMRQDFTPFNDNSKAVQMSAARRFGGQNLKGLKKLGQGRDRVVYALDNDKVLKVAKNPGGLTQNTSESDLNWLGLGEEIETGKDYVVAKRNKPLSQTNKRKLAEIRNSIDNMPYNQGGHPSSRLSSIKGKLSEDDSPLNKSGIGTDVLNYDFSPEELFANRQWGEDDEGNLRLNDGGALQPYDSFKKHRVKDFSPQDWQWKEWQDVQQQRRTYRDRGNYSAPVQKQNSQIPEETYNTMFGDDDNDGVLNYNDCCVDDPNRQGPWHAKQTLWHAGDKPPSQTLKDEGRVFGFSSKQYAEGWKEKHNKQNIYRFTTDDYELDDKSYVRPLPGGKRTMSDNEYISLGVDSEDVVEDMLEYDED